MQNEVLRSSLLDVKKGEKLDEQKEKESKAEETEKNSMKEKQESESKETEPIHTQREEVTEDLQPQKGANEKPTKNVTEGTEEGPEILVQETVNEVIIGDTVIREVTVEGVILEKRKLEDAPSDEPPAKFARIDQEEEGESDVVT